DSFLSRNGPVRTGWDQGFAESLSIGRADASSVPPGIRRARASDRTRTISAPSNRGGPGPLAHSLGSTRHRKDDTGEDHRQRHRSALHLGLGGGGGPPGPPPEHSHP